MGCCPTYTSISSLSINITFPSERSLERTYIREREKYLTNCNATRRIRVLDPYIFIPVLDVLKEWISSEIIEFVGPPFCGPQIAQCPLGSISTIPMDDSDGNDGIDG